MSGGCCDRVRVKASLEGFTATTGLHGYAYYADPRHWAEIAFWALFCVVAVVITGFICYETLVFWENNSVATS